MIESRKDRNIVAIEMKHAKELLEMAGTDYQNAQITGQSKGNRTHGDKARAIEAYKHLQEAVKKAESIQ